MSSLLAFLSQQTPNLQTRKGLIVLGLQNDFVSPDGKLPLSSSPDSTSRLLGRLKELVPAFREFGDIIWVRSEFEANRDINVNSGDTVIAGTGSHGDDDHSARDGPKRKSGQDTAPRRTQAEAAADDHDEELFLLRTAAREPCCIRGSWGAEYPEPVQALVDEAVDMQVIKTYYSAFGSTSLLLALRSRLITELYVCGCNTNLSVFATAMDAARYGIKITLVEDCLGYRIRERHDEAIRQLVSIMGAEVTTVEKAIDALRNPRDDGDTGSESEEEATSAQEAVAAPGNILIETDSQSDEEELESFLPNVRARVPNQTLSLRCLSLRSRPLAAPHGRSTAVESAKSTSARKSDTGHVFVRGGKPDRRRSQRARLSDGIKLEVSSARDSRSVAVPRRLDHAHADQDDSLLANMKSSKPVHPGKPWLDMIKSSPKPESTDHALPVTSTHPGLAALSAVAGLTQETVDEYEGLMAQARAEDGSTTVRTTRSTPLFGDGSESECDGSRIHYDFIATEEEKEVFYKLKEEIEWQRMHHRTGEVPRLVCCQGEISEDGDRPLYRHPSDQTLPVQRWTSTVEMIRKAAEARTGHPLNHALIQLYRGGSDYISEHSDKTLDVVEGSKIVNVSFGAQRTMRLRTKRDARPSAGSPSAESPSAGSASAGRTTHRVSMPHNSMIEMSLETNAKYLHGINADKRPAVELVGSETAYGGQRISLTFRQIGTFLSADEKKIWGQGATGKTRADAKPVISGDTLESEELLKAFGAENQASSIDWEAVYGSGSDVLHIRSSAGS